MAARWLSTLLLTSVALAAGTAAAADDEQPFGGGTRFYGGTRVERPLQLAEGEAHRLVRWRLAVHRTVIAKGECLVDPADPRLRIDVPEVQRVVEGRLVLNPRSGGPRTVPVTLHPKATGLADAFGPDPVGWVGATAPLRVAGKEVVVERVLLASPAAVRRFRGALLVVPPSTGVDEFLAAALLDRARQGAAVLVLGAIEAPWVAAVGESPPGRPSPGTSLEGIDAAAFDAWGRGGAAWKKPLGTAEGNHAEWMPDHVRALYPGSGQLVVAQLDLLDALDDEPWAAALLVRLLRRIRTGPPPLSAPRSVAVTPGLEADVTALFGPLREDGPAVVATPEGDLEAAMAKVLPPVVVLGDGVSFFHAGASRREGPGLDVLEGTRRPELLRFLTEAGLRVTTDRYWR